MFNPFGYYLHIPAWLEAPYSVAISAPSHRNLYVALEFPLMASSVFFYCLISADFILLDRSFSAIDP